MLSGIIIVAIILVDQVVKFLIRTNMSLGDRITIIPGVIELYYTENPGASFGILADNRWVFMILSTVALIAMVIILIKYYNRSKILTVAMSMIIAGGTGNMIDRLFYSNAAGEKVVVDMFNFSFVDFAVFNVADMFITFGGILLAVYIFFIDPKIEKLLKKQSEAITETENADVEIENDIENNG